MTTQRVKLHDVKAHMLDKGLRESSANTYLSRLRVALNKYFNRENPTLNQLKTKKTKFVESFLNTEASSNSKKVLLMAIIHLLNTYSLPTQNFELTMKQLSNEADAESLTTKSEETKEAIEKIDFDSVKEKRFEIKDPHNRLLASLYTMLPPLRQQDYSRLLVLKAKPKTVPAPANHINLKTKQMVINTHKTSNINGQKIIQLPDELITEIQLYLKTVPKVDGQNILLNMSSSALTRRIASVFGHSSGLLRKAYITQNTPKMTAEELLKTSEVMGHRLSTAQLSYNKNTTTASQ